MECFNKQRKYLISNAKQKYEIVKSILASAYTCIYMYMNGLSACTIQQDLAMLKKCTLLMYLYDQMTSACTLKICNYKWVNILHVNVHVLQNEQDVIIIGAIIKSPKRTKANEARQSQR